MLTEPSTMSHTARLGFPSAAKALGGAWLSEGLHQGHTTRFRHPSVQPQENHGAVWAPRRHWGSGVINKKILRNICKVRHEQHIIRNVLEHVSQQGCAVWDLEGSQNLAGSSPKQAGLISGLALSRAGGWPRDLLRSLPTWVFFWSSYVWCPHSLLASFSQVT